MPEYNRELFERDFRSWMLLMSMEEAHRLLSMPQDRRNAVLSRYSLLRDPKNVFHKPLDPDRLMRLSGGKLSSFIVIETSAVVFYPSIYSFAALDFAVAMNRRYFYRGLWFPIISLNSEYIRQSSDKVLAFAIEHELEMCRIYHEISLNLRTLSADEKRNIMESAEEESSKKLQITQEELRDDEKLMHKLSSTEALIPKLYAERAMLLWLEDNFSKVESCGLPSISPDEEVFGEELLKEFKSWSEISQNNYELFVREISANLRDANKGYG